MQNRTRLGTLAMALALASCHQPGEVQTVSAAAVIDESSLDFGIVPLGEWHEAAIHVRNVGRASFNVLEALKVNGDGAFYVDADPGRVRPGERRPVHIRFHPTRETDLTAAVRVQTDADR